MGTDRLVDTELLSLSNHTPKIDAQNSVKYDILNSLTFMVVQRSGENLNPDFLQSQVLPVDTNKLRVNL